MLALALAACEPHQDRGGANEYRPRPSSKIDNGWPPMRFRGDVVLDSVEFLTPAKIPARCGVKKSGQIVEACAYMRSNGKHTVILPNPCKAPAADDWARLTCHEIGHLNGWPADHGA